MVQSESGKKGGGCYIATAVYGSYDSPEVLVLRGFRDEVLAPRVWGRALIKIYYAVSPSLADRLERATTLNRSARRFLDGIVRRVGARSSDKRPS